jgi:hypothetical protein
MNCNLNEITKNYIYFNKKSGIWLKPDVGGVMSEVWKLTGLHLDSGAVKQAVKLWTALSASPSNPMEGA